MLSTALLFATVLVAVNAQCDPTMCANPGAFQELPNSHVSTSWPLTGTFAPITGPFSEFASEYAALPNTPALLDPSITITLSNTVTSTFVGDDGSQLPVLMNCAIIFYEDTTINPNKTMALHGTLSIGSHNWDTGIVFIDPQSEAIGLQLWNYNGDDANAVAQQHQHPTTALSKKRRMRAVRDAEAAATAASEAGGSGSPLSKIMVGSSGTNGPPPASDGLNLIFESDRTSLWIYTGWEPANMINTVVSVGMRVDKKPGTGSLNSTSCQVLFPDGWTSFSDIRLADQWTDIDLNLTASTPPDTPWCQLKAIADNIEKDVSFYWQYQE